MSKVNNIATTNGEQIKIAVANTTIKNIMSNANLPANTLIISSNINNDKDNNQFGILITDFEGQPAVISKTIKEGNGLKASGDILKLNVNNTISNDNGLRVNLSNCIDNNTLEISNNKINVSHSSFAITSETKAGMTKIDEETIKLDNKKIIYADVNMLTHATDTDYGVVKIDGETIVKNDNDFITINSAKLSKATKTSCGIVKLDKTLNNDVQLKANTSNLDIATNNKYGILKGDEKTIHVTSTGVLSVNYDGLDKASTNTFGLIKFNKQYFNLCNGIVTYKYYTTILNKLNNCEKKLKEVKSKIYS